MADFDLLTYSFPCFVAGTYILTANGYKEIQDVVLGDRVLTHLNRYCEVEKVGCKPCATVLGRGERPKRTIRITSAKSKVINGYARHLWY